MHHTRQTRKMTLVVPPHPPPSTSKPSRPMFWNSALPSTTLTEKTPDFASRSNRLQVELGQALTDRLNTIENRLATSEARHNATDETLVAHADRLENTSAAPSSSSEPRMPDLPVFNGTTPPYHNWDIQRKALFSVQQRRFHSAATRTAYLGALLSGPALEVYGGWAGHWDISGATDETTALLAEQDLLTRLHASFASSNRQTVARSAMKTMQQKANESTRDYTMRWLPLRRDAGYSSDDAVTEDLIRSLLPRVRTQLRLNIDMKGIRSDDFSRITQEAIRIDELLQVDEHQRLGNQPAPANTNNATPKTRAPPPDHPPPGTDTSPTAMCWIHRTGKHTNRDCIVQQTRARQTAAQGSRRVGAVGQEEEPPAGNGAALGDANPRA